MTKLRPGKSRNIVSIPCNCRRIFFPLKPQDLFCVLSSPMFNWSQKLSPLTKRPKFSRYHLPHLLMSSIFKHVTERNSQSLRLYSFEYMSRGMPDWWSLIGKTEFLGENLVPFLHDQWQGLAGVSSVWAVAPHVFMECTGTNYLVHLTHF